MATELPPLNDDLIEILGRPNFACIPFVQCFREAGHTIRTHAEEEQAFTLHWMLGHYLKDPANWRKNASSEIKELQAVAESRKTAAQPA